MAGLVKRVFGSTPTLQTPIPPSVSFASQTVLVTGATSGLGLATAILYAQLGAEAVYITARTLAKGQVAKAEIEKATATSSRSSKTKTTIQILVLEMDTFASIDAFMKVLQTTPIPRIDVVLLNAGIHNYAREIVPGSTYEADIQVNALSTVYLALRLIPWMRRFASASTAPQHLGIVGSGNHMLVDISTWAKPPASVLADLNSAETFKSGVAQYSISKLILHYCIRELAALTSKPASTPSPIITLVCPGVIATDLGKQYAGRNLAMKYGVRLFLALRGSPPSVGATTFVHGGALNGPETHGAFLAPYVTDDEYRRDKGRKVVWNDEAVAMQARVWAEVRTILEGVDPQCVTNVVGK